MLPKSSVFRQSHTVPERGELELERGERLGAHLRAVRVDAHHCPVLAIVAEHLQHAQQRIDQPRHCTRSRA